MDGMTLLSSYSVVVDTATIPVLSLLADIMTNMIRETAKPIPRTLPPLSAFVAIFKDPVGFFCRCISSASVAATENWAREWNNLMMKSWLNIHPIHYSSSFIRSLLLCSPWSNMAWLIQLPHSISYGVRGTAMNINIITSCHAKLNKHRSNFFTRINGIGCGVDGNQTYRIAFCSRPTKPAPYAEWPEAAAEGIQLSDDSILVFHSVDARHMQPDFPSEQEC